MAEAKAGDKRLPSFPGGGVAQRTVLKFIDKGT
jgi:hypothetical protein